MQHTESTDPAEALVGAHGEVRERDESLGRQQEPAPPDDVEQEREEDVAQQHQPRQEQGAHLAGCAADVMRCSRCCLLHLHYRTDIRVSKLYHL